MSLETIAQFYSVICENVSFVDWVAYWKSFSFKVWFIPC